MKTSQGKKLICLLLCCALLCGVGAAAYAAGAKSAASDDAAAVNTKDETVYVIASADGTPEKIIVSDWIKNELGSDKIEDVSDLKDVENVKGDETYVMNGDNMRVWDAQGNDICYRGETDKKLPVDLAISCTLDGVSIAPADLAGKSGHVTMRFDYTNNQTETVSIDGKETEIHVPFVMLTGMMLDTDKFTNVEVSNGKMINDGERLIVAGLALPGLAENLDIDQSEYDIPDYVEISADVTDFELTTTLTVAVNDMFNDIDPDKLDSLDELNGQLDQLTDGMNQLMDGSSQLYDGLAQLLESSGTLVSGVDQLAAGAQSLANGGAQLNAGAGQLAAGAAQLSGGLNQLSGSSAQLNAGAKQVFDTLLATANSQLKAAGLDVPELTVDNYAAVLSGVLANLDENAVYQAAYNTAYASVSSAVRANEAAVRGQVMAAVRSAVVEGVLSQAGLSMSESEYNAAVAAGAVSSDVQSQIQAAIDAQMASDTVQAKIDAETEGQIQNVIDQQMRSSQVTEQINAAVESAKKGAGSIAQLKTQLDSYNTFYQGLTTYTAGVDSAAAGAAALNAGAGSLVSGTEDLSDGAKALLAGIQQLQSGSGQLVDGVTQLKDGAMSLSDGLKQLNDEGIEKIVDAAGGLDTFATRLRAIVDVAKDYKSFTGISDDMDGTVRFIYKTASIEAK